MARHDHGGPVLRPVSMATAVAALLLAGTAVSAQAPTARPAGDPAQALEAARVVYEALPLPERVDIQDGLVWSGDYSGALDGTFGRMTFQAIAAFQARNRLPADGILTAAARKTLADGAKAKKAALGFQPVDDKATGVRIHLPTKLLGPPQKGLRGTGWIGREGRIRIDTYATVDSDLAAFFERMKTAEPGRKVVYAVLRPDWFVISDEIGTQHRYARFVRGAEGIRGFHFTVDASLATELDRVVIATAGRFEPFPGAAAGVPAAAPATAPATVTAAAGATPVTTTPAAAVVTATTASGLTVAPGKVLTAAAAVTGCRSVTVGGRPATIATAEAGGLATLATAGDGAGPVRLAAAADGGATVLAAGESSGRSTLVAVPGDLGDGHLRAALQSGGLGAPVFDATGALVGLVLGRPDEARAIAGLIPAARYDLTSGAALEAALTAAGATADRGGRGEAVTTGRVVAGWAARVVPVTCRR